MYGKQTTGALVFALVAICVMSRTPAQNPPPATTFTPEQRIAQARLLWASQKLVGVVNPARPHGAAYDLRGLSPATLMACAGDPAYGMRVMAGERSFGPQYMMCFAALAGETQLKLGNSDKAKELLDDALSRARQWHPGSGYVQSNHYRPVAEAFIRSGSSDRVEALIHAVPMTNSTPGEKAAELMAYVARCYANADDPVAAEKWARAIEEGYYTGGSRVQAMIAVADYLERKGERERTAKLLFDAAFIQTSHPRSVQEINGLIDRIWSLGQRELVRSAFVKFEQKKVESPNEICRHAASLFIDAGELDTASELIRTMKPQRLDGSESVDPVTRALVDLAVAYGRAKNGAKALECFEAAGTTTASLYSESPDLHYNAIQDAYRISVNGRLLIASAQRDLLDTAGAARTLAEASKFALAHPSEPVGYHLGQGYSKADQLRARDSALPLIAGLQFEFGDAAGMRATLQGLSNPNAAEEVRQQIESGTGRGVPGSLAATRPSSPTTRPAWPATGTSTRPAFGTPTTGRPPYPSPTTRPIFATSRPTSRPIGYSSATRYDPRSSTRPFPTTSASHMNQNALLAQSVHDADKVAMVGDGTAAMRFANAVAPEIRRAICTRMAYILSVGRNDKLSHQLMAIAEASPASDDIGPPVSVLYGDVPTAEYDLMVTARVGSYESAIKQAKIRLERIKEMAPHMAAVAYYRTAMAMAIAGAAEAELGWIESLPQNQQMYAWTGAAEGFLERMSGISVETRRFNYRQSGF